MGAPSSLNVRSLSPEAISAWPGGERRDPPRSHPLYLVFSPLADQIRGQLRLHFGNRRDLRVLDVGCGCKPFFPLIAPWAETYRGLDAVPGPAVDDVGKAERMPYPDDQFDLVVCTQVLEHVDHPDAVVSEFARVVKAGGLVLASTHGVYFYHPNPENSVEDLWRWTHVGLRALFEQNASWERVDVRANRNLFACLGVLAAVLLESRMRRRGLRIVGRLAVRSINAASARIDDRLPRNARVPHAGSLATNYLVSAVR